MKKFIILFVILLTVNTVKAASLDLETGRNIIINDEKICLDNITQITWYDSRTNFALLNGDIKSIPTTYNEYIEIMRFVWKTRQVVANSYYNYYGR